MRIINSAHSFQCLLASLKKNGEVTKETISDFGTFLRGEKEGNSHFDKYVRNSVRKIRSSMAPITTDVSKHFVLI